MKRELLIRCGRYLGVAAAVAVPALVIAQQQPAIPADGTFTPDALLRAGDVEALRDGLAFALQRLNQLESSGSGLRKADIRQVTGVTPAPVNAIATAGAVCSEDEIMLHCGCRGISTVDSAPLGNANNTSQDLRMVLMQAPTTVPSCTCQSQNSGSNNDAALVAVATCLPL